MTEAGIRCDLSHSGLGRSRGGEVGRSGGGQRSLTTIGSSVGVILPKEALSRLKVEKGDIVFLTEDKDGFRITPFDPEFEKAMESARKVMKRRRNALRELAK